MGLGLDYQKATFKTKIGGGLGQGSIQKNNPYVFFATVEASNFNFGTQTGFGTSLPKKRRLGPKLAGVWARGASKKIWDPNVFLQPLKLAISNLVHKLGLGRAYRETTFWTIIGGGARPGEQSRKIRDPLRIFATVKASSFKFRYTNWVWH